MADWTTGCVTVPLTELQGAEMEQVSSMFNTSYLSCWKTCIILLSESSNELRLKKKKKVNWTQVTLNLKTFFTMEVADSGPV